MQRTPSGQRSRVRLGAAATCGVLLIVTAVWAASNSAPAAVVVEPPMRWTNVLGTSSLDTSAGLGVTPAGDVYAGGGAAGVFPTSGGVGSVFATRYDKNGNQKWVRQFGTGAVDYPYGIAVAPSGDVYLTGSTTGAFPGFSPGGQEDAWIARYDKNGNQKWVRQFGTTGHDRSLAIAASSAGDVYVTGTTDGTLGSSPVGMRDAFLARYDRNGNRKWLVQFGTTGDDEGSAIAVSAAGDVYVAGQDGGLFPNVTPLGGNDVFIARFDKNGNRKWVGQFGANGDTFRALAVSGTGDAYGTGLTLGPYPPFLTQRNYDAFLVKYDKNGNRAWIREFGSPDPGIANAGLWDEGTGVAVSKTGAVYVAGTTQGQFDGFHTSPGAWEAFLTRFDAAGNQYDVRQLSVGAFSDFRSGVGILPSGDPVVDGTVGLDGIFGHPSFGNADVFLADLPR